MCNICAVLLRNTSTGQQEELGIEQLTLQLINPLYHTIINEWQIDNDGISAVKM